MAPGGRDAGQASCSLQRQEEAHCGYIRRLNVPFQIAPAPIRETSLRDIDPPDRRTFCAVFLAAEVTGSDLPIQLSS
jgi:hypothetical protein